jgi:hypothetical protein
MILDPKEKEIEREREGESSGLGIEHDFSVSRLKATRFQSE